MAVLRKEAEDAGYDACVTARSTIPRPTFEDAWTAFNTGGRADLPVTLHDDFKRGWSRALAYIMASS